VRTTLEQHTVRRTIQRLYARLLVALQDPVALEHAPVKGLVVVDHLPWHDSILRL